MSGRRPPKPPTAEAALGGRRAVLEAIRAGRARRLLLARGSRQTQGLRELLAEATRSSIAVRWVQREALEELGVLDHQGVVAFVSPPRELDDRALEAMALPADALAVILDGITDPQNLGACARSAEAAGCHVLIVRERRAAPASSAAIRASAGALLHLPVARVTNLVRAMERLKDRGFTVVGLDAAGEALQSAPAADRPMALVVGAEGEGLSRLVRERCDRLVSIPMRGRTASLNAAAALAVGLFGYAVRS